MEPDKATVKADTTPLVVGSKAPDRTVKVKTGVTAGMEEQVVNGKKYLVEQRGALTIRRRIG